MQRHEVVQASWLCGIGLPLAGWLSGAYLGEIALLPFPQAVTAALRFTAHHPYLAGGLLLGLVLAALAAYALQTFCDDGFRGAPFHRWLRGSRMVNPHRLKSLAKAANRQANRRRRLSQPGSQDLPPILIGWMPMPLHLENRNTLICASVGAGKSVAMESMLASAVKRGDKLAIVDPNGTFYAKFSLPGDTILNPFDQRSVGWSLFNEIKGPHDFDRIAKSAIPPQRDPSDEQWCGYARDVLADTMRKLMESNNPDQTALVKLLVREDSDTVRSFLANTDSQGYFRENAEKAVASVRFMLTKYVRPLRWMRKGDFSLHQWVQNPHSGNLFLTWREDMRTAQQPLVAMWIDTICATILSQAPTSDTRLWLYLEELASLGKLESLVPAASKGRKHGLRIVGSIQDWAQLEEGYGQQATRTLLGCFRNYVLFGAANALNAGRASEVLGQQQVERLQTSTNTGSGGGRSRQTMVSPPEPVVLDAEIANLKDLSGYVMFGEDFPIAKLRLPWVRYPAHALAIDMR